MPEVGRSDNRGRHRRKPGEGERDERADPHPRAEELRDTAGVDEDVPTLSRVTKVDDIPAWLRSRNSSRLKWVPTATMKAPRPSRTRAASRRPRSAPAPRAPSSRAPCARAARGRAPACWIRMEDQLGARAERAVRHRVHVTDDDVRLVAGLDQPVRAPSTPTRTGQRLDVVTIQVSPTAWRRRAPRRLHAMVAWNRPELRQLDALGEELPLPREEPHRVSPPGSRAPLQRGRA